MREIKYYKEDVKLKDLDGTLRIVGRNMFFKSKNNKYQEALIASLKQKGAFIQKLRAGWVRVNIFSGIEEGRSVKLGEVEFDPVETTHDVIEKHLFDFYMIQFTKAGFSCKGVVVE